MYKSPELMREKNLEFNNIKIELGQLLKDWEIQTAELQKAEEKFS